jgi:WD40 repeat protein
MWFWNPGWLCRWNGTNQILVEKWNGSQLTRCGAVTTLHSGTRPNSVVFNPAKQLVAWKEPAAPNSVLLATLATPGRRIELKSDIAGLFAYPRFSDDGKYLAAATPQSDALQVWNVDTGQSALTLLEPITDFRFAVGGRVLVALVVVSNSDYEIRFYDLNHPDRSPRRIPGKHEPGYLAVSPDGRLVAATTEGGTVRLCDAVSGELKADMSGHLNGVFGVAFSKDGRRLISSSGGREAVKLWDVFTRQELLNLSGTGSLLAVAWWSPDGDTILAGAPWQAWRAPSWEEIAAAEAKEKAQPQRP